MRVDAHVHVWPGRVDGLDGSLEALVASLAAGELEAAVLVQPSLLGLDHAYLEQAVGHGGLQAVAIAQAVPGDDRESLVCLAPLLRRDAFAGFRLPILRGGRDWFREWWPAYAELAAAHASVVCLLVAPDQFAVVAEAAESAPDISIVVDHLGRPDLSTDAEVALGRLLALAPNANLHVKVSALSAVGAARPRAFVTEAIRAVVDAFGADRVMWGSDHPFEEPLASCRVAAEALDDRDGRLVLGESARQLFFVRAS